MRPLLQRLRDPLRQTGAVRRLMRHLLALALLFAAPAMAGPYMPAGDIGLRHDVQTLADAGIIKGTVTTWPMAWGPVLYDLGEADLTEVSPRVLDAIARLRVRARWETAIDEVHYRAEVSAGQNPIRIRGYDDTPRGEFEAGLGLSWIGERFSAELQGQYVEGGVDEDQLRLDQSRIGVALGNWSVSASTMDRWWGPGWDGSLILSNNARPIPSVVIDRIFTDAFESSWLSWAGPWDLTVMFGQLENARFVPDARFFGMRLTFRPFRNLEIGLSRTAQWCGDGRPCDLDTFGNLLLGRDNRGDDGTTRENEPGNQLAGYDLRYSTMIAGQSLAVYLQAIGEDEAGGFPSRYMGQVGVEWSGYVADKWSTRVSVEYTTTDCDFYGTSDFFDNRPGFNCAYNNGIYQTGYRYKDNAIGHGADNDAELLSVTAVAVDAADRQWRASVRAGKLNRGGAPDERHTITPTPKDLLSIDLSHSRPMGGGTLELVAGFVDLGDSVSGASNLDARLSIQWRSDF